MESGKCIQIVLTTLSIFGIISLVVFVALEYNKEDSLKVEKLQPSLITSKASTVSQTSMESTTMTSSSTSTGAGVLTNYLLTNSIKSRITNSTCIQGSLTNSIKVEQRILIYWD